MHLSALKTGVQQDIQQEIIGIVSLQGPRYVGHLHGFYNATLKQAFDADLSSHVPMPISLPEMYLLPG